MSHHYISVSNVANVYSKLHLSKLAIQSSEANSPDSLQTLADSSKLSFFCHSREELDNVLATYVGGNEAVKVNDCVD